MNKSNDDFKNLKEFLMYYHTSIRNVALTTTVSFAALAYARYYKELSPLYGTSLTFVSVMILFCSFTLNYLLYSDVEIYKNKFSELEKWQLINKIFIAIHLITIFLAMYTLYRALLDKRFKGK
jgi:hypothetical protein